MAGAGFTVFFITRGLYVLLLIACICLHEYASAEMYNGALRDELRKVMLGSRPPACMNKCLSCRPCEVSLVIPSHRDVIGKPESNGRDRRDDDSYYHLTWRCRCGTKLYEP